MAGQAISPPGTIVSALRSRSILRRTNHRIYHCRHEPSTEAHSNRPADGASAEQAIARMGCYKRTLLLRHDGPLRRIAISEHMICSIAANGGTPGIDCGI